MNGILVSNIDRWSWPFHSVLCNSVVYSVWSLDPWAIFVVFFSSHIFSFKFDCRCRRWSAPFRDSWIISTWVDEKICLNTDDWSVFKARKKIPFNVSKQIIDVSAHSARALTDHSAESGSRARVKYERHAFHSSSSIICRTISIVHLCCCIVALINFITRWIRFDWIQCIHIHRVFSEMEWKIIKIEWGRPSPRFSGIVSLMATTSSCSPLYIFGSFHRFHPVAQQQCD